MLMVDSYLHTGPRLLLTSLGDLRDRMKVYNMAGPEKMISDRFCWYTRISSIAMWTVMSPSIVSLVPPDKKLWKERLYRWG
jgi:hypothetical protein